MSELAVSTRKNLSFKHINSVQKIGVLQLELIGVLFMLLKALYIMTKDYSSNFCRFFIE